MSRRAAATASRSSFVDDDYPAHLAILGDRAAQFGLDVRVCCLMSKIRHGESKDVHLVVVPQPTAEKEAEGG